jgi:transcription-repair coupling factor (superfamily II helicase)
MANVATVEMPSGRLPDLAGCLEAHHGFDEVVASLLAGNGATLDGVGGSSCALVAATLVRHAPGPLLVVCPHPGEIDSFADDLALFTPIAPHRFPAWEMFPTGELIRDDVFGDRLRLLKRLAAAPDARETEPFPKLIVSSVQSLLQPVPSRAALAEQTRRLRPGDEVDLSEFTGWLARNGFHATSAVELPGEFSLRGGILDLFAPDWFDPVRVEFFGEQIESLRRFEISSQRSLTALDQLELTVLRPDALGREHFTGYLPANSWVLLIEPSELEEEGRRYIDRLDDPEAVHSPSTNFKELYRFPSVTAEKVARGSFDTNCHLKIESVERFSGDIQKVRGELDTAGLGQDVYVVCHNQAEVQRLSEVFGGSQLAAEGRLHFPVGSLQTGFRLVPNRIVLISSGELFHRTDLARPSRRRLGRVIDSFLELREGDYIVHVAHGIGRYRGLRMLEKNGQVEEHLELEFRDAVKIFVPASKINLVQKYVGGAKSRPTLARIGGGSWERTKQRAQAAVSDLASDMLDLQAARGSQPGISFPLQSPWQKEFGAAFPYRETPDQLTAIAAIDQDMLAERPMDRLICGDVGYGKTEVAMRAAFKAVDAGYQVGVLVPTTVLAEQHRRTFTERMAEYPFQIASLSRFSSPKEQRQTLAGLEAGSIDIVIGTHRLAQHDVKFNNLGLLIIDEEQRFGVDIKERLKALRRIVDVLTLTATPIPRTLHMSLLGLRDISNLETPPEDRVPVETRVTRFDADLIRHAVLRELNRGGQIYFVHNRVQDIHTVAQRLGQIVPEATIRVGHGQMNEHELEEVMLDFVDHRFDLLLATTIIESGLDIPNANTMFIDEADCYGLADLHQLRGRVGRYKHRAYCYLLVDQGKSLTSAAAKRLRAIEEFSDMGAGFAVAMRDLEIRGAGNILGTEQSGHIASVGYELYCQLLEQAVLGMKKLPPKSVVDVHVDLPGEAYLPRGYVPDMRLKIDLYRRLNRVTTEAELNDLSSELVDRFGPLPVEVDRLLDVARVRLLAQQRMIRAIHLEDKYVVLGYGSRAEIDRLVKENPRSLRIADGQSAYLPLPADATEPDAIRALIKSLLRPK